MGLLDTIEKKLENYISIEQAIRFIADQTKESHDDVIYYFHHYFGYGGDEENLRLWEDLDFGVFEECTYNFGDLLRYECGHLL